MTVTGPGSVLIVEPGGGGVRPCESVDSLPPGLCQQVCILMLAWT